MRVDNLAVVRQQIIKEIHKAINTYHVSDVVIAHHSYSQGYNKKLIFATTTPVLPGHAVNRNEDIIRFNDAIVPVISKMGVGINDLFSVVNEDPEKYICDDQIHLSQKGIDACAKQVVRHITALK